SQEKLVNDLSQSMSRFNELETEFNIVNQEYESAQSRGNISEQRELRTKLESMNSRAQDRLSEVRTARQSLVLIQYVYFQSNETQKAVDLATQVNEMMGSSFPP
ncbi:MAG TPA: DUF2723 domain-containing protein, partial [Balneolaceae bacterium]|nr:DUF2723 domain-containing protein [Balneolaceae bacterium]